MNPPTLAGPRKQVGASILDRGTLLKHQDGRPVPEPAGRDGWNQRRTNGAMMSLHNEFIHTIFGIAA